MNLGKRTYLKTLIYFEGFPHVACLYSRFQPVLPFHFFQNPLKTGRKTPDIPPDFFTACKFPKNSPIVNPYLYESTLHYLGVHIVLITSAII